MAKIKGAVVVNEERCKGATYVWWHAPQKLCRYRQRR